jgi:hypothetical protein
MARTFPFILVELPGKSSLVPVLQKSVKSALLVKNWETRHVSYQAVCSMHLRIGSNVPDTSKAHFMLADDSALYDFLKAFMDLEGHVLEGPVDGSSNSPVLRTRILAYRIDFPQSGNLETKQRRLETQLLKPFFDLFWSGFNSMTITGATDSAQRSRLLESVRKDRWSTTQECIDFLSNLNLIGTTAYQQSDFSTAYKHWEHADHTWTTTLWTSQAVMFQFPAVGAPLANVLFQIRSNLAALFLEFANAPRLASEVWENRFQADCLEGYRCCSRLSASCSESSTQAHEAQLRFAAIAHEYCMSASVLLPEFQPSDRQLSNLHYRRAQALRLRGCLMGNLQAGGVHVSEARRLCLGDAAVEAELERIRERIREEREAGTAGVLEVRGDVRVERDWEFFVTAD